MACGILIPQPGTESMLPAVQCTILNAWTAKEVPKEGNFLTKVFQPKIQLYIKHIFAGNCHANMYYRGGVTLWSSNRILFFFFFSLQIPSSTKWMVYKMKVKWQVKAQSYLTLCDPMDCSLPGSSIHWILPGKNTRVGGQFLLQGIFLPQRLNLGLPDCRQILYHLNHREALVYKIGCSLGHFYFFFLLFK